MQSCWIVHCLHWVCRIHKHRRIKTTRASWKIKILKIKSSKLNLLTNLNKRTIWLMKPVDHREWKMDDFWRICASENVFLPVIFWQSPLHSPISLTPLMPASFLPTSTRWDNQQPRFVSEYRLPHNPCLINSNTLLRIIKLFVYCKRSCSPFL